MTVQNSVDILSWMCIVCICTDLVPSEFYVQFNFYLCLLNVVLCFILCCASFQMWAILIAVILVIIIIIVGEFLFSYYLKKKQYFTVALTMIVH